MYRTNKIQPVAKSAHGVTSELESKTWTSTRGEINIHYVSNLHYY